MHKHGGDIYSDENCIDFSANINWRGMPARVRKAAWDGVAKSGNYPDPECRRLTAAIAKREGLKQEQVICGNGAADLIFSLARARQPQHALLFSPTFFEYEQALRSVGCELKRYELKEERGFVAGEDMLE